MKRNCFMKTLIVSILNDAEARLRMDERRSS